MGVPQQAQNGLISAYKDVPPTSGCWLGVTALFSVILSARGLWNLQRGRPR